MQALIDFMLRQHLAVVSSLSADGRPQSALIGMAATRDLELVFDTLSNTRKCANLRHDPHVSVVVGGWERGDERTVQYEGIADFPSGAELENIQHIYFTAFPEGRARLAWPGIIYVRIKPEWVRFSNFNVEPPEIVEHRFR